MKTLIKKSGNGSLLLTCMLILSSLVVNAQDKKLSNTLTQDLSKDGFVGFYIIGGILGFGIIGFILVSMYEKRHKDDDKGNQNVKHISHHRHHHHHKVIKKSA